MSNLGDRMGLNTRQLQDLRLRGIGPPIVQRGLSIHYELADVMDIERHEAMAIIDQVLASDRPLTLLRAMAVRRRPKRRRPSKRDGNHAFHAGPLIGSGHFHGLSFAHFGGTPLPTV